MDTPFYENREATMRNTIFCFSFIVLFLCCPLLRGAEEVRTWKDDTGLFSVEASLQQIVGDLVKLQKTDGNVITLPLVKLSEADRRYIAGLTSQNPFEDGASSKSSDTNTLQSASGFPNFAAMEVRTVDFSQTREAGGAAPNVWSCEADPAPQVALPENVVRLTFRLQDIPMSAFPRRTDFAVDPTGKNAVAAFHVVLDPSRRDTSKNYTRIFLGNTVTGAVTIQDSPLKLQPHGFSADGKRFAFHQDTWEFPPNGKRTLLHITEVTSTGWTAVATFEPFAQLKRTDSRRNFNGPNLSTDADIFGATWVDDKHLLVQSESGTLILLDIDTGKAVWRTRTVSRGDIALSPGGKYCFLPVGSTTVLWETLTGKAIGAVDEQNQKFRFSPSGKRFATCSAQGIILGDTTTGAREVPFFVPGSSMGQRLLWLDERFLLLGGSLVDTASKAIVWHYIGLGDNVKLVGGYSWCAMDLIRDGTALVPLTLPHATMKAGRMTASSDEIVLKPGVSVSVTIDDSVAQERKEIRESIEKKIADNGWVLADDAPITIALSLTAEGKTDTVEYGVSRSIGPVSLPPVPRFRSPLDGKGVEVEFKPERYDIKILEKKGDKELWSATKTTSPPSRLPLDVVKADSLQEVVDKAMEANSYKEWIDKVFIPKTISRPQTGKGESRVTENGIVDVSQQ